MELVNRVSASGNYQIFSGVIAEAMKQASENSEPMKSAYRKPGDSFSVMASWWSCRIKKASEFIKSSATFTLLYSFSVIIVTSKPQEKRQRIFKMSRRAWKINLPIWQKGLLAPKMLKMQQ